jgi:arsenate reductase
VAEAQIFHNPRCSKSRGALTILEERGVDADVVLYLDTPPDRAMLERILAMIDDPPVALVRTKDDRFRELGIDPGTLDSADAVASLLVEHPEVMERPVVVRGDRAVIGRPPERVLELFA